MLHKFNTEQWISADMAYCARKYTQSICCLDSGNKILKLQEVEKIMCTKFASLDPWFEWASLYADCLEEMDEWPKPCDLRRKAWNR